MKKIVLTFALVLSCAALFAQKLNKSEVKQLRAFLQQTSATGETNYQLLEISPKEKPTEWKGVTWKDGRVAAISWADKKLNGALSLSGFTVLTHLDCARNQLTSFSFSNCPSLAHVYLSLIHI